MPVRVPRTSRYGSSRPLHTAKPGRSTGVMTAAGRDAYGVDPADRSRVIARTPVSERGANFSAEDSSRRMGVSMGHRPGRETTRALLEKIAAGEAALKLRRQVIAWNP